MTEDVTLQRGMLLLDPESAKVYAVASKSTIIAHHGSCSEKAVLRQPGVLPKGWKVINNKALAKHLLETFT